METRELKEKLKKRHVIFDCWREKNPEKIFEKGC